MDEIEAKLNDLGLRIDRLKILYEQYFLGMEKAEPTVPRKEVMRLFEELRQVQIRNTALRFRHGTLLQRWNTYTTRWGKTLREIELGIYTRHLARARRKGVVLPPELEARVAKVVPMPEPEQPLHRRTSRPPQVVDEDDAQVHSQTTVTIDDETTLRDSLVGLLDEIDDGAGTFVFEQPGAPSRIGPSRLPPSPEPTPPTKRMSPLGPLLTGGPRITEARPLQAVPRIGSPLPPLGDVPRPRRPTPQSQPPEKAAREETTQRRAAPQLQPVYNEPPASPASPVAAPRDEPTVRRPVTGPPPIPASLAPSGERRPRAVQPGERFGGSSVTQPPSDLPPAARPTLDVAVRELPAPPRAPAPVAEAPRPPKRVTSDLPPPNPRPPPLPAAGRPGTPAHVAAAPASGRPPQATPSRLGAVPIPPSVTRPIAPPPRPPARPAPPPPRPVAPPAPPRAASPIPGMTEDELRSLHRRYVEARRSTGSGEVRYEALLATLKKQVPDLLNRHHASGVVFDVTVRDGRAIVQARPKK